LDKKAKFLPPNQKLYLGHLKRMVKDK